MSERKFRRSGPERRVNWYLFGAAILGVCVAWLFGYVEF